MKYPLSNSTRPHSLRSRRGTPGARPRVLAVASSGGHWVQLLRLRPAFTDCDLAWVTVDRAQQREIGDARFHVVRDATRWNRFGLIMLALQMMRIVLRERPNVVITTGAAPGFFAIMFGRLLGARTIWLDSMANVERLSLSGVKAGRWSSMWLTQWPKLATPNGPEFRGSVL